MQTIKVYCRVCGKEKCVPLHYYRRSKYKRFYCGLPHLHKHMKQDRIEVECEYCRKKMCITNRRFLDSLQRVFFCNHHCHGEWMRHGHPLRVTKK